MGLRKLVRVEKGKEIMDEIYIEETDDRFFDASDEICCVSNSGSGSSEHGKSGTGDGNYDSYSLGYEVWTRNPESIHKRRTKFQKWMGLALDLVHNLNMRNEDEDVSYERIQPGIDQISEDSGAVPRFLGSDEGFSSCHSTMSDEAPESSENVAPEENHIFTIKNLDDGTEFVVDRFSEDGVLSTLREVGSNRSVSFEEFEKNIGQSLLVQQLMRKTVEKASELVEEKKAKGGWPRIFDRLGASILKPCDVARVRVHSYKKKAKELSSLFAGQEFQAHEGSILTMKFSLDGRYLASGGEDAIVRVWKVSEGERLERFAIPDNDPSSLYFTMNHLSKLEALDIGKEGQGEMKRFKRSSDNVCVIFPPKIFRISEKPLHEFQGHVGEVLDLSWSKKGFLLSSSVDKTVRLWQLGCHRCLGVYSHNNYVTSVNFNPLDENHFISGSIDGKVRIWEVLGCQVVDYIDIREIVSAVSYRPDGKGGIVGSMTGNCRFYKIIDNRLELDAQICLHGKKKSQGKRITGFQFSPSDSNKLLVSSADSPVHLLSGVDVISKFKGRRSFGNQISASFTSDGKHIVSASEENVYIWNYSSNDKTNSRTKNIRSCESFFSPNASIAIPWCGMKVTPRPPPSPTFVGNMQESSIGKGKKHNDNVAEDLEQKVPLSPRDFFSPRRGFLEFSKGSATWPAEKLVDSSPKAALSPVICKLDYKFLKNACQSMFSSPHMWGSVIVTAGWDGRIRTYLNYGLPIRF